MSNLINFNFTLSSLGVISVARCMGQFSRLQGSHVVTDADSDWSNPANSKVREVDTGGRSSWEGERNNLIPDMMQYV